MGLHFESSLMGCEAKESCRMVRVVLFLFYCICNFEIEVYTYVLIFDVSRKLLRVSILFPLKTNICSMWRGHCKFTPEDVADVVAKTEHAIVVRMTSALIVIVKLGVRLHWRRVPGTRYHINR
jgi:hypothetical protein